MAVLIVSSGVSGGPPLREIVSRANPGCQVSPAPSGANALSRLAAEQFQIVVLHHPLPDLDSAELGRMILHSFPEVSILIAGSAAGDDGIEILRDSHPAVISIANSLQQSLQQAAGGSATQSDGSQAGNSLCVFAQHLSPACGESACERLPPALLPDVIGSSTPMALVSRLVRLVANRVSTVLITGETGTGKERIARAIHEISPRARQPFVVVNCGAIPETLFESELFGFERGAFTGAQQSHMGRIQAARGGTLFLDEVGELPLAMQTKLLRFLQEHEVQRIGSNESVKVDVRIIAATNANLPQMAAGGTFRKDLYYRLSVFPIALPPLRHRREDILVLAQHFLTRLCRDAGAAAKRFSAQTSAALKEYDWPGNVREIEHVVERAFIFAEGSPELHCELVGHCYTPTAEPPLRLLPARAAEIDAPELRSSTLDRAVR